MSTAPKEPFVGWLKDKLPRGFGLDIPDKYDEKGRLYYKIGRSRFVFFSETVAVVRHIRRKEITIEVKEQRPGWIDELIAAFKKYDPSVNIYATIVG